MIRLAICALLGAGACATTGSTAAQAAASCDDFSSFARSDDASPALKDACARSVMSQLLSIREQRGAEAVQQQLDAMAMAFSEGEFSRLINETTADSNVRAMAALAAATAATARSQQAHTGGEQEALNAWQADAPRDERARSLDAAEIQSQVAQCEPLGPDSALACLSELHGRVLAEGERAAVSSAALTVARAKVQALQRVPPAQQGIALGKLITRLQAMQLNEPSVRAALEVSRAAVWPSILEAESAGRIEQAAVLAEPYGVLATAKGEPERLRDAAAKRQMGEAVRAGPRTWASAFHRQLALRFGASVQDPAWPAPAASAWDTSRFECTRPAGKLPELKRGMQARLVARCTRSKRETQAAPPASSDPSTQTFDNERSLEWEQISGTAFITCAGKLLSYRFSSRELAFDSGQPHSALRNEGGLGMAGQSALSFELAKLVAHAEPECATARLQQLERDCAAMSRDPLELEDRFTQYALAQRQWPACFTQWLDARLGIAPPPLPQR